MKKRLFLILGIVIMTGGLSQATLLSGNSNTAMLWHMNSTGTGTVGTTAYTVVQDDMSAGTAGRPAIDLDLGNKINGTTYTTVGNVPTLVAGLDGSALQYTKSGSQGTVAFDAAIWNGAVNTSLTFNAYFKTNTDTTDQTIMSMGPCELRLRGTSSNKLAWFANDAAGVSRNVTTASGLSNNTWYHVIASDDGSNLTMSLYTVNASTLVETQVGSTLTYAITGMKTSGSGMTTDLALGAANAYGSLRPFQGLIDDVRIDVLPAPTPEPVSALLLTVGGLFVLRNRKK